jgi:hypothetical protein
VLAGKPFRPLIPEPPAAVLRDELTISANAADQQVWVRRVDAIVRDRFSLTSVRSRMTDPGTVSFQDLPTFARGFGMPARDLLIEAFAENLGSVVDRIRVFYNVRGAFDPAEELTEVEGFVDAHFHSGFHYWNSYALDWTDYGLTGITDPSPHSLLERVPGNPTMANASSGFILVTQEQAQAAARRQPGVRYEVSDYRSWPTDPQQTQWVDFYLQVPLSRVTNQISAGEILAQTYAGVTGGGTRGSRPIRISSTPGQPATGSQPAIPAQPAYVSTLVHEACHFYTHDNFNRFVDGVRSARTIHSSPSTMTSVSTIRLSPILQEGFTEYFARLVMREQTATLGTTGTGYQAQYEASRLIIDNMNPPQAAESAYFHGIAADIQKVRDGIQFVEQNPNLVRVFQGLGLAETERALDQVRAPVRPTLPGGERLRPRTQEDVGER